MTCEERWRLQEALQNFGKTVKSCKGSILIQREVVKNDSFFTTSRLHRGVQGYSIQTGFADACGNSAFDSEPQTRTKLKP